MRNVLNFMPLLRNALYFMLLVPSLVAGEKQGETLTDPPTFKIGFLGPWSAAFQTFSALTSASALTIAIEKVDMDPSLNSMFKFE